MSYQIQAQTEHKQMPLGMFAALRIARIVSGRRVVMAVARPNIKPIERGELSQRIRQKRRQMRRQRSRRLGANSKAALTFERLEKVTRLRATRQKRNIFLKKSASTLNGAKRAEHTEKKPVLIGQNRTTHERGKRIAPAQKRCKKLATQKRIGMRKQRLKGSGRSKRRGR
jgi:hypothetical protein